jgi:hypothetical protein
MTREQPNLKAPIMVSDREKILTKEINEVYNAGELKRAMELSVEFLKEFPKSHIARYEYSVAHGDYSYSSELSDDEKRNYREIANKGIKALAEDPELPRWDQKFQFRVRNEYYWFFQMPEEQYNLGIEKLAMGEPGHYSATVGASMMALRELKNRNPDSAKDWAQKALLHFEKFEDYAPDWHNINFFAAQAAACLGDYENALIIYKDIFRKQKKEINEKLVNEFKIKIDEIRKLSL